jgi:hypothetical protein
MSPLLHDLLPMVADRLEWALNAPTTPDDPRGLARLARALAGIATALALHAMSPDVAPEAFGLVDPDMLPFTPLERKVRQLRTDHAALLAETEELRRLVGRAARPATRGGVPGRTGDVAALYRRVDAFLGALRRHQEDEEGLDRRTEATGRGKRA